MSKLWSWIDGYKLTAEKKTRLFLFINSLIYSIIGFFVWLVVSSFALNKWYWALCFAGYPGFFIGYVGGFLFLCRK